MVRVKLFSYFWRLHKKFLLNRNLQTQIFTGEKHLQTGSSSFPVLQIYFAQAQILKPVKWTSTVEQTKPGEATLRHDSAH